MDKIGKALKKISEKEKKELKGILKNIKLGNISGFDVKKLKGHDNVYRIRKGVLKIIFLNKDDDIKILVIERRSDNTYNL